MELGNFFLVHINYLAVIASAVADMIIGYVWYGPLFGKQWLKMMGVPKGKLLDVNKNMSVNYSLMFVSLLVMAYVLAHFVWYAAPGSLTVFISVKTAVWAWLGFLATYAFTKFLFNVERKPWSLYFIDVGYYFVALVVMGVVFALLP